MHQQSELFAYFFVPISVSLGCLAYNKNGSTFVLSLPSLVVTKSQIIMGLSISNAIWAEATSAAN